MTINVNIAGGSDLIFEGLIADDLYEYLKSATDMTDEDLKDPNMDAEFGTVAVKTVSLKKGIK